VGTVDALLREGIERLRAAGSASARLDAELLLGFAIHADRTALLAHPEAQVGTGPEAAYRATLDRRAAGEPVAYIRGVKEFFGLAFAVDGRALIPRPETERLVELAEAEVIRRLAAGPRAVDAPPILVADVGTGSGTIAVALAAALRRRGVGPELSILASDASPEALALARENAVGHAVADRIRFVEADLLPPSLETPFDLVLGNLPYVRSDAIAGLPVATSFEPRSALDGGPDGLAVIERLLARLPEALAADGVAMLEIGGDQASEMEALVARALPGWSYRLERDLGGLPRVAQVARERAALGR
jgi:release factor glutamine methyltransferase